MNAKLKFYQKEANKTRLGDADPYEITKLLMAGVMDSLAVARGAIERSDFENKGKAIAKASAIIASLRSSLDLDVGAAATDNLIALYDYMIDKLVDASVAKDSQEVDEVASLFREIKSAWDDIPMEAREQAKRQRIEMSNVG